MATDLKIEIFSNELLQYLYKCAHLEVPKRRLHKGEIPNSPEVTSEVVHAVSIRGNLYYDYYTRIINNGYYDFSVSGTTLYTYLLDVIPLRSFPYLNIFDKILSLYAFCFLMAFVCFVNENDIYIDVLPLCCAMYFDNELKDEFYGAGGWDELNRHASTYLPILLLEREFQNDIENAISRLLRICSNYDLQFISKYAFEHLSRRIYEGKSENTCLKCNLLFGAFSALRNSYEYSSSDKKFIEGILQVMLCMPSKVSKFPDETLIDTSHMITETNQSSNVAENSYFRTSQNELDIEIPKVTNDEQNKNFQLTELHSKEREFLRNLFANFDDKQVEIKPDLCTFCYQTSVKPKTLSEEKSLNEIKLKIFDYVSISDFEYSTVIPENSLSEMKIKSSSTLISEQFEKLTISESKHHPRNSTFEKALLRLFLALGIEPVTTEILSSFNDSGEVESNKKINSLNYITKENVPKIKRKRNRKPKKKGHKKDN